MAIALIIAFVFLALYLVSVYNRLQRLKARIKASIQEIGNQLKRQIDLIPNLVEATKGYLKHEKDVFDTLAKARQRVESAAASGDPQKMVDAQDMVKKMLSSLQVVVESNPEIKGAAIVSQLMAELRDTADKVMYARRTLIDLTVDYNQILMVFPSNIIAKIFGFNPEKGLQTPEAGEHLEVSRAETKTPKVKLS